MSIKQMIDQYLIEWEEKCNVQTGAVNYADLSFGEYCHATDTIEVGISIKQNWITVLYAWANLKSEWVCEHLDELNALRAALYETIVNAEPNERYEAARKVLKKGNWSIIDHNNFADSYPF